MLARDSLAFARRFMADVIACNALASLGDEAGSRRLLAQLAERAEREAPVVAGVIEALERIAGQLDTAQAAQLTKRPSVGFGVQPQENPHAANDHTNTSEQPGPSVA